MHLIAQLSNLMTFRRFNIYFAWCTVWMTLCCLPSSMLAQSPKSEPVSDEETEDDDMEDLRYNPGDGFLSEGIASYNGNIDNICANYPFISLKDNVIKLNGDDWTVLRTKLLSDMEQGSPFTIVHIGDSHLQCDISSRRVRDRLSSLYGFAGRGLIVPLRITGTNQPDDYKITSSSAFHTKRLMQSGEGPEVGFTGVSIVPESREFEFNINANTPFEDVTMYYNGCQPKIVSMTGDDGFIAGDIKYAVNGEFNISLIHPVSYLKIRFRSSSTINIYGFNLKSDTEGVLYHTIGNNGAAYISYCGISDFGSRIAGLTPDLVIISLGTNEAYGRLDQSEFTSSVDRLVSMIKRHSPGVKILLTTPSETQRKVYTRQRRRRKRVVSYSVNGNVAKIRQYILDYGKAYKIPVYDWYEVAGGENSSVKWLADNLLSKDRIHKTRTGYAVEGELLFNALNNIFINNKSVSSR